jgi:microcystin-dependent protein
MPTEPFLGELMICAFDFAPKGWAMCNGQLLPINQNQALFAILGTTYGGNGTTNFALPNLQSRLTVHQGQGAGLSPYTIGQTDGEEFHTLILTETPTHTHTVNAVNNGNTGGVQMPGDSVLLGAPYAMETNNPAVPVYSTAAPTLVMNPQMVGQGGSSQPHENRMPFLVLNWCIALQGIFPSRN